MSRISPARALVLVTLLIGACGGAQELTPPPPPLRPAPEADATATAPRDCVPTTTRSELVSIPFNQRSIPEGAKLAQQGTSKLRISNAAETEPGTRKRMLAEAVDDLITALRADPYNVSATYNLAAAYARIDRPQCVVNLLTRMLQLRLHASKHADVEHHLDRLLGRKQALDPDFADMRRDERFRELIQKMCEGSRDPTCVFGAARP
ncbi:MAG: hypothetical protein AB7P03_06650 [Kofleriaceae bacterium]